MENLKIQSKEELKYVMDFYQIPFVPLRKDGWDMGSITKDMKYEHPRFGGRYFLREYEYMAFELAYKQILDVISLKKKLDTEVTITQTSFNKHNVWEYPDTEGGPSRHHVYPITVTDETDKELTGTLREIFNETHAANNSLRYCNGMWIGFKDKELEKMYRLFLRMDWNNPLPITLNDTF